jgi:hypothetical protein
MAENNKENLPAENKKVSKKEERIAARAQQQQQTQQVCKLYKLSVK